jgi:HSP20 family molecular chaperone IbpA
MERILAPSILDSHFFDDIFDEINYDIYRMHHDLRRNMARVSPQEPISAGGDALIKSMKSIRDNIVTKDDGNQEFRLIVDVNAFKPEEIDVKIKGKMLTINAKHEEKSEDSEVVHQFTRSFTVPEDVDPESLVCSVSKDGVLTVKGPVGAPAIEAPPEKKQKTGDE